MHDMQDLYTAVMILGRSRTEVMNTGWVCATIGSAKGPKCINGVVAVAAAPRDSLVDVGGDLPYIAEIPDFFPELTEPVLIATRALVRMVPRDVAESIAEHDALWGGVYKHPDSATVVQLGQALVDVNDHTDQHGYRLMSEGKVLAWIEAAQDLLAQQLPNPIPATSTHTATRELGSAERHRQGHLRAPCPGRSTERRTTCRT